MKASGVEQNLKLKLVILTIALGAVPAFAQNAAPKKTLKVLNPEEVDPGRLLPPPPPDDNGFLHRNCPCVFDA